MVNGEPDMGSLTGLSAIIVAFISGVAGPYIVARMHLKIKGITPQEAAQATNRATFRRYVDETATLAVELAHSAQETAVRAEGETIRVTEENKKLTKENTDLRERLKALEIAIKRIPKLEAQIKNLRMQLRTYKGKRKK